MKAEPGTYALILQNKSKAMVEIGRWRQIEIEPGYYIYIGSAFGKGGVKARVLRHYRENKPHHWHIDYLREFMSPITVWYSHGPKKLEHDWAQILSEMSDMSPIQGFGCSDCKCFSHLFHTRINLEKDNFSSLAGRCVKSW